MKKGLGHFTSTSVWNGNVAVCGHNRGAKYVIGSIKDLDVGDKITYTTSMGTRTYLVETVTKISSSDWSYLSSTTDNRMDSPYLRCRRFQSALVCAGCSGILKSFVEKPLYDRKGIVDQK